MKVLGVVLDRRLAFDRHVTAVARACNYHAWAIQHIGHLSAELADTLNCSLILSRLDYCNAVLYGAQVSSIQKLQRVQNTAARIVTQSPRRAHALPLLEQLHWLPVRQRIEYKLAVLTFKIRRSSTPAYASPVTSDRVKFHIFVTPKRLYCTNLLYQNSLCRPCFLLYCYSTTVWNSFSNDVGTSLAVFKSILKTFLFRQTFRPSWFSRP